MPVGHEQQMAQIDIPAPAPPGDLQRVQRKRKLALRVVGVMCIAAICVTGSYWRDASPDFFALLRGLGVLFILACIFGRTWCTLYIGGLKKKELISLGPYSIVRNPLYVFTILGTSGIGLLTGSLLLSLAIAAMTLFVFWRVVLAEEVFLARVFGSSFTEFAVRVPRFWPRFSAWKDADELRVKPWLVLQTFLDASLFLLAVPLIWLKDQAQASGWLPVLVQLH
jgi:protein-S-isoprenylcysteine O-methyltransferase Ste14